MTDLLVQRLKNAKRELTALKTAHKRGLGLLKIYRYGYKLADLGVPNGRLMEGKITIVYSEQFPAYPLARFASDMIGVYTFGKAMFVDEFVYESNGYMAICDVTVLRSDNNGLTKFVVFSTAPIKSLTFEEG